jgi:hypothetical protein
MSQYYGALARARGDRLRAKRNAQREAERERRLKAWLASPEGKKYLACKARRVERQKTCCVCGLPVTAVAVSAGCCSWECAAVHWLRLDELEEARRAGMPVAEWRRGPGADEHARYLNLRAERLAAASHGVKGPEHG